MVTDIAIQGDFFVFRLKVTHIMLIMCANGENDMNQEELRLHRCCFTGHRPDKMKIGEKEIKPLLEKEIDEAIADGYVTFITGMAMGTDIWAAEIVLERKRTRTYILYVLCHTQILRAGGV